MQTSIKKTTGPQLVVWIVFAALALTSCSATRYTRVQNDDDDVYYSTTDIPVSTPSTERTYTGGNEAASENGNQGNRQAEEYYDPDSRTESAASGSESRPKTTTESFSDENGNTYVTNNYYGNYYESDDYYDYAYSARIRRFHRSHRWSYYDPYYTNMYWYDYNPYSWGVSIYCGYRWWRPYYHRSVYISYGDPWYYSSGWYGYGGWPYWGYGHGYRHGYRNGYWDGYYDGYYGNNNPYYYNSRDYTSHYYGPRGSMGSNGAETPRPKSIGQKYEEHMALDRPSLPKVDPGRPFSNGTNGNNMFRDPMEKPGDPRPGTNIKDLKQAEPTGVKGTDLPGNGNQPRDPRNPNPQMPTKDQPMKPNYPGGETVPDQPAGNPGGRQPDYKPSPQTDPPANPRMEPEKQSPVFRNPETRPPGGGEKPDPEYRMNKPREDAPTYTQPNRQPAPSLDRPQRTEPRRSEPRTPSRPRVDKPSPTPQGSGRSSGSQPSYRPSPSPSGLSGSGRSSGSGQRPSRRTP